MYYKITNYDFTLRAATAGVKFARIPEFLYGYTIHSNNKSKSDERKAISLIEKAVTEALERLGRSHLKAQFSRRVNLYRYFDHVEK